VPLDEGERVHFETFGYVVLRAALTPAEVAALDAESLRRLEDAYAHAPFRGTRYWAGMNGPTTPLMAALIEDPRFWGVAEQLLGEHAVGGRCDASRCSENTIWHPDVADPRLGGVQFALYLQPVGADSGALRVVPGSHRSPLHGEVDRYLRAVRPAIDEVPAVALDTSPGDAICYDIRLWHAVAGAFADRRFCNMTYYHLPPTPESDTVARAQDLLNRRFVREMMRPEREAAAGAGVVPACRPHEALYDPEWVANRTGSPIRARWLARLGALGFLSDRVLPDEGIVLPHSA
jgi:hypothetical protein